MTKQPTNDDPLFWQACQYVQGELSAEAEESFEEQLAVDQAAREAVALAAEVHNAIHAACAWEVAERPVVPAVAPAAQQALTSSRRWQWVVGLLAASIVAMVTLANKDWSDGSNGANGSSQQAVGGADPDRVPVAASDSDLALLWAQQLDAEPTLSVSVAEESHADSTQEWEGSEEMDAGWMWLAISDANDEVEEEMPEGLDEGFDEGFDQPLEESL